MKMRLLTLNGPLGAGKTWIRLQLEKELAHRRIPHEAISWQDPLRKACYALLNAPSTMAYDDFKTHLWYGRSGRDWMIGMSEDFAKRHDPLFFSKVLADSMFESLMRLRGKHLFIADSNGFDSELGYMRAQNGIEILAGCIEPPGSPPRGEKWVPHDSRLNLAHMCDQVAPTSGELLQKLLKSLEYRGWI